MNFKNKNADKHTCWGFQEHFDKPFTRKHDIKMPFWGKASKQQVDPSEKQIHSPRNNCSVTRRSAVSYGSQFRRDIPIAGGSRHPAAHISVNIQRSVESLKTLPKASVC